MSRDPTRERLAIFAEVNSARQARFIPAFASYHSQSTVSCRLTNAIRILASAASVFSEISPVRRRNSSVSGTAATESASSGNDRGYLLRGLVRCATCGGACTGHNSWSRGKTYHYYACRAAKTYNFGVAPPHKTSFVSAEWLEDLVWSDVRRFLKNPGAILERLHEQHDAAADAGDLEARKKGLAKRLAAKQAEKDRYVRAYAQAHISEEELDAYLAELKKQIDNLRVLLASVEAELSERQERKSLTDTTQAWLLSLGRRLEEVEEDTPEGFEKRKQLVGLLVAEVTVGKKPEDGRTEVRITYRFGPPPASGSAGSPSQGGLFVPDVKNGSRS
jgi:Recombinase zinc beta ribbon domain